MTSQLKLDGNVRTTRVNGKGLWRSWKRNFKNKLQALLDLIDNSLDAAIQANGDGTDRSSFKGRVHVFPDVHEVFEGTSRVSSTTSGLCIVNNCMKKIRPLDKVLEVYDSSKVESGAGDIGENGVGLKQGCATLSDLSFVLVKNGSNKNIELGIVAKALQKEQGCFLPAFNFSNLKDAESPSLRDQMLSIFSQTSNDDVASCIAQYGAASSGSDPNLVTGAERLCQHFDYICSFFDNSHVFMVIMDKVHHGLSEQYVRNAWDAQQKITVNHLIRDLREEIPKTYLHIPNSFDFRIGRKAEKSEFKYWPARMVELSSFTVDVNPKIPWQQKFDHPDAYQLRVFIGFDGMRITDSEAGKEASLYVYSRQSGRLISHNPDARTLLGLSAGGTMFCQGLTIIIDDIAGNLPLNPTKQEVAFGEEAHGEVHKENLMSWVGSVVHFYYSFHLKKCGQKKTVLTRKIAGFGDVLMDKNRHLSLKTLDSSDLTTHQLSFKSIGKSIRADKSSAQEIVGVDTLCRLSAERSSNRNANKRSRNTTDNDSRQPKKKIPRRTKPSESDREKEEVYCGDDSSHSAHYATQPSNPHVPRCKKPVSYQETESDSDRKTEEVNDSDDNTLLATCSRASQERHNTRQKVEDVDTESVPIQSTMGRNAHIEHVEESDSCTKDDYRTFCARLTKKTKKKTAQIKALTEELAKEKNLRQHLQQQIKVLQGRIKTLETE